MSLLKCPKCGEMFSDSYKTCPFCEEDEAFANGGKKPVNPGRRVHRQKSPSILGPTLVLVLVLVAGVLALYPHRQRKVRRRPARSPKEPHGGRGPQSACNAHCEAVSGSDGSGADRRRHRETDSHRR
ncbi:MAG: hypothetical protein ACLU38_15145 [Dysosmobacter sp.]